MEVPLGGHHISRGGPSSYWGLFSSYRLRCSDSRSGRNPRWEVRRRRYCHFHYSSPPQIQGLSDFSFRGLGQLRLQGVGFSAISVDWRGVARDQVSKGPSGRRGGPSSTVWSPGQCGVQRGKLQA